MASAWRSPPRAAHPKLEVNVIATTALANFGEDEVDVAIRFGKGPWPPLACEKFLEDEFFPVASPKLLKGKPPRTPRDLLGMRLIREDRDFWDEWFRAAGISGEKIRDGGPRFNDSTYALQAAARGEGVAMARRSIVGEDFERGRLRQLFDVALESPYAYWFVSPREAAAMPKVKAFRDWVKQELA